MLLTPVAAAGTAHRAQQVLDRHDQVCVPSLQVGGVNSPSCDLMRAGLAEGELVLLVCGGGPAGEAATRQHIEVSARRHWRVPSMPSCTGCGGVAAQQQEATWSFTAAQAVDPPTKGVPLRQLLRLQLDAAASGIAVHFCGNSQVRIAAHGTFVTTFVLMRIRACLGAVMG